MKHITDIIVYKNRCEVIQSHSYTEGDIGAPHLRMIFDYMFERDSLKGLTLECKYILPSGEYSIKNVEITEDKEVLFPIYYSVFEHSGWTTLKATLVDENNRITLDDIVLRVKKLNTDNLHTNEQFNNMLESEVRVEVKTITDAIKKEIDDYVKINKETLKGEPGVVDYTGLATSIVDKGQFGSISEIIEKDFYGNIRFNDSSEIKGLPDVKIFFGNMFVSRKRDTAIFLLAPDHTSDNLYFLSINARQATDIENTKKRWVKIWHTGNLDFQKLEPITIDSSVGNHVILKRLGELKGSLTSNVDGIALYNEKSKKMIELRDNGDAVIPANNLDAQNKDVIESLNRNNGQWISDISLDDVDALTKNGWYKLRNSSKNAPTTAWGLVNNLVSESHAIHQFWISTLLSGDIYHRRVGQDWVRIANENDINDLKKEIQELRAEIKKLKEFKGDEPHEN